MEGPLHSAASFGLHSATVVVATLGAAGSYCCLASGVDPSFAAEAILVTTFVGVVPVAEFT